MIYIEGNDNEHNLYNLSSISNLLENNYTYIYLDVTGLENRVCAPVLKLLCKYIKQNIRTYLNIVYIEPREYKQEKFKSESVFSNLSEKIDGISPLPGFATITPNDENSCLVAYLGFEGSRFMHILENVEFSDNQIVPVIGVPGFRPEYPHIAYWSNKKPLEETNSWLNVRYAKANSITDAYLILMQIIKDNKYNYVKVAPIGTKPHAIGVMLASILNPKKIEIIYDNPIRKVKRTEGIGKTTVCNVNELINDFEWE